MRELREGALKPRGAEKRPKEEGPPLLRSPQEEGPGPRRPREGALLLRELRGGGGKAL